jgi:hypothetical protein
MPPYIINGGSTITERASERASEERENTTWPCMIANKTLK